MLIKIALYTRYKVQWMYHIFLQKKTKCIGLVTFGRLAPVLTRVEVGKPPPHHFRAIALVPLIDLNFSSKLIGILLYDKYNISKKKLAFYALSHFIMRC